MKKNLNVLVLEKSEKDTAAILKELKGYGYNPDYRVVDHFKNFSENLKKNSWDAIIASKELDGIKTEDALKLLKSRSLDIPFIIVSEKLNEGAIIPLIKAGANDYVHKGNLFMLPPILENEIKNTKFRKKHKKALGKLKESERRFRILAESASDIIYTYRFNPRKCYEFVSPSVENKLGYSIENFYQDPKFGCKIVHDEDLKITISIAHEGNTWWLKWIAEKNKGRDRDYEEDPSKNKKFPN